MVQHGTAYTTGTERECRLGVWFGFVGAALLPAVVRCVRVRGDAWSVMLSPCNTTGTVVTKE